METLEAIASRRSIRKHKTAEPPRESIEKVLLAGARAPSAKNRQPWRFIVVEEKSKTGMIQAMEAGLSREKQTPMLPDSQIHIGDAERTVRIMEKAPVNAFILSPGITASEFPANWEKRFFEISDILSVGACIENMLLAAAELGLGTLWNCNIFFAYPEICRWLAVPEQVVSAVAIGVPVESPFPRPRKPLEELVEWK